MSLLPQLRKLENPFNTSLITITTNTLVRKTLFNKPIISLLQPTLQSEKMKRKKLYQPIEIIENRLLTRLY